MKKKVRVIEIAGPEQIVTIDSTLPVEFTSNLSCYIVPKPLFDSLGVLTSAQKTVLMQDQYRVQAYISTEQRNNAAYAIEGYNYTYKHKIELSGYKQFVVFAPAACKLIIEETDISDEVGTSSGNTNAWLFSQQVFQQWIANQ